MIKSPGSHRLMANSTSRHILPNTLNIYKFHGSKREADASKFRDFDIVLTTYATLAAEFCSGNNVLHHLKWFRVVLDEGMLQDFPFSAIY
jgi:SWI/SNF-related matrix-associated actin-dependent regulator of chromatin subfamily A3